MESSGGVICLPAAEEALQNPGDLNQAPAHPEKSLFTRHVEKGPMKSFSDI